MRIYIAGPISATSVPMTREHRLRNFERAESLLERLGHEPVSPLKVDPFCGGDPADCAANSTRVSQNGQDGKSSHAWECYMKSDLVALLGCDAIALLPYYLSSEGAQLEAYVARVLNMPCLLIRENNAVLEIYKNTGVEL